MPSSDKFLTVDKIEKVLSNWRAAGQTIVFTNGCFDILHLGHVQYLEKAAALGDKLVIGLNTDRSVRQLKGSDRPLNREESRGLVLSALGFVDLVCLFDEDTPLELIKRIKPNVLVKGGDYTEETIVGSDFVKISGGLVATIPLTEGFSTTGLIHKINSKN